MRIFNFVDRCSVAARGIDEPTAGTAPVARSWLLIEQPGPWGRDALTGSRLDPDVAAGLLRRADHGGTRIALIRRPADKRDTGGEGRDAYLVSTAVGAERMRHLTFENPADLLTIDLADPGSWPGEDADGPLLLICTNAKRDVCCALDGRPLAEALAAAHPDAVWESNHLGGHRFSPTAVVLPYGYAYAWLDQAHAEHILDEAAAGRTVVDRCRGRSTWTRPGQSAELAVRAMSGERAAGTLFVGAPAAVPPLASDGPAPQEAWHIPVTHADGRRWTVRVAALRDDALRPESCGKPPVHPVHLVAMDITAGDLAGV